MDVLFHFAGSSTTAVVVYWIFRYYWVCVCVLCAWQCALRTGRRLNRYRFTYMNYTGWLSARDSCNCLLIVYGWQPWSNTPQQSYFLLVTTRHILFFTVRTDFCAAKNICIIFYSRFFFACFASLHSLLYSFFYIFFVQNCCRTKPREHWRRMNAKRFNAKSWRLNVNAIILDGICFIFYLSL